MNTVNNFRSIDNNRDGIALEQVSDHIAKGECILFLGAGIHAPPPPGSCHIYPEEQRPLLAGKLAEKLAAECKFCREFPQDSPRDLQRVSLCYEYTPGLGRRRLIDSLDEHLNVGKQASPALEMLAELDFKIIVTTNYDRMLEDSFRKLGKNPIILRYDPSPDRLTEDVVEDPTGDRPLIFKIHGDLAQRHSIVITDEDYITFVQRMSDKDQYHPVPMTIRYWMQRKPTLFFGYSLRDYNLRLLFRTLRWRIDLANIPPIYSVDNNPDPLVLRVWQDERRFITFVTQDLWEVVPWLQKKVRGKERQNECVN